MSDREELIALRRMAELEAKAAPQNPVSVNTNDIIQLANGDPNFDVAGYVNSQPTTKQMLQGTLPGRVLQGIRDPINGLAQLTYNALPKSVQDAGNYINDKLADVGLTSKMPPGGINEMQANNTAEYNAAMKATGNKNYDLARFTGNVISPVNAAVAKVLPITSTNIVGQTLQGARNAGLAGAAMPVDDPNNFWSTKAFQTGVSAVTGGVLTPIMSKIGDAIGRKLMSSPKSTSADEVIKGALDEIGQKPEDIPSDQFNALKNQVNSALQNNKQIDPAAVLRKQDFEALNIDPTLGQITRDSAQFSKERNLRGVANVGEPLLTRFEGQNQKLVSALKNYSNGSQEPFIAGENISNSLKNADEAMRKRVADLYSKAYQSSGKDLDVPIQNLSKDYLNTLDSFGDKIPSAVRKRFEQLSVGSQNIENPSMATLSLSTQKKPFSFQDAESLIKTINDNVTNDPAANRSLDMLRNSVKKAILEADDKGGVFSAAREAAAQRFKLQDAVPALEAASKGTISPDDFVNRFIINGKTNDVKGLADVLSKTDPNAFNQAKAQIGETLQRAAYGNNVTGDKNFAPERYAEALRKIGTEKLSAFFTPEEVSHLKTISRVGSYINVSPTASPVNTSNTAGTVMTLAGKVPFLGKAATLADALGKTIGNNNFVREAMAAQPPAVQPKLSPEQIRLLTRALGSGAVGVGAATGNAVQ